MSYFETYLKRVNRYGNTLQERVQGKKEHDFLTFMDKSPNLVNVLTNKGEQYKAVLQTKEYDEDEVIDYLLVPLDREIPMGTVIHTISPRFEMSGGRNWINYALDPYTSTGYNRYTIVELESELYWVYEGVKYTSLAHAVGGGSGARDKAINLKFKTQFSESGIYLPNKRYSIVMPYNENLKKNIKVTLGGETWRVTGFDNVSIKGVSYVTLEEVLTDKDGDIPIANAGQLENFSVMTNLGENFTIPMEGATEIKLLIFYGEEQKQGIQYTILENDTYKITSSNEKIFIIPIKEGKTSLKVVLEGWTEAEAFEIPFVISTSASKNISIVGPKVFYMGDKVVYKIENATEEDFKMIGISNDCARLISTSYQDKTVVLQGEKIGKSSLFFKNSDESIKQSFDFSVNSIWLGGA